MKRTISMCAVVVSIALFAGEAVAQQSLAEQRAYEASIQHSFDDLADAYKAAPSTKARQAVYKQIADRATSMKSAGKPIPHDIQIILDNPPIDIPGSIQ